MNDAVFSAAYKAAFERITSFAADRDTDVTVPACPAWSTTDVVRHLSGISADIVDLVLDGFGSDEWTEAQVSSRRSMSHSEVVEEWARTIDSVCAVLASVSDRDLPEQIPTVFGVVPPAVIPAAAVSDILHHEFDIRNAYGDAGSRDLLELHFAAAGHVRTLRGVFAAKRLPTITIRVTESGQSLAIGRDESVATVSAPAFELFRGIGGRRTRREMLGWEWDGDGESFVDHMVLPHLSMRTESLNE